MKDGTKDCPFCGTRMEFKDYHLVDWANPKEPCLGCRRLIAMLEESRRRRDAKVRRSA